MTTPTIKIDLTPAQLEAYFKALGAGDHGYHLTVADVGRELTLELCVDSSQVGVCIALLADGTWTATAQLGVAT